MISLRFNSIGYRERDFVKLKVGDHIEREMYVYNGETVFWTGNFHQGIVTYIDFPKVMITHKWNGNKTHETLPLGTSEAVIEETDFGDFQGEACTFNIIQHENYTDEKRKLAVKRAKTRLEKNKVVNEGYNLVLANCENFVLGCILDRYVSNSLFIYKRTTNSLVNSPVRKF
jgi:hypothetical protein